MRSRILGTMAPNCGSALAAGIALNLHSGHQWSGDSEAGR
jgi:hypothetical protein